MLTLGDTLACCQFQSTFSAHISETFAHKLQVQKACEYLVTECQNILQEDTHFNQFNVNIHT